MTVVHHRFDHGVTGDAGITSNHEVYLTLDREGAQSEITAFMPADEARMLAATLKGMADSLDTERTPDAAPHPR